jgi:hypothetical protein
MLAPGLPGRDALLRPTTEAPNIAVLPHALIVNGHASQDGISWRETALEAGAQSRFFVGGNVVLYMPKRIPYAGRTSVQSQEFDAAVSRDEGRTFHRLPNGEFSCFNLVDFANAQNESYSAHEKGVVVHSPDGACVVPWSSFKVPVTHP